jgi:diguanylate cyclase (GGDEF)-like protein
MSFAVAHFNAANVAKTYHWHQISLCTGILCIHLILLRIGFIAAEHGEYHYQNGSIIAIIFLCNVLRIDFRYILPTALVMWFTQIFSTSQLLNASSSQIIEQLFIYSLIAFISCLVNARMEHEVRRSFLQGIVLAAEQQELEKARDLLFKQSVSDELTKIFNRRGFDQFLARQWAHASRQRTPLTLLLLDIDYFKRYNDKLGHQAGDKALIQVAEIISQQTRRSDDLCARWGGEEFVVLLPQTDLNAGLQIAENIRHSVWSSNVFHPGGMEQRLSVSIGVATMIPENTQADYLLKEADKALYQAKAGGRNRVCGQV